MLIASIVGNLLLYRHSQNIEKRYVEARDKPQFKLLSPNIAWMNTEDFVQVQKSYSIEYQGMKDKILNITNNSNYEGYYGIYFEDLNTGAWIGINEKEEFVPASLLKIPVLVATLKKVENGELSFEQTVLINKDDLDLKSGTLGKKGAGYNITIKDLLTYLIKESDNTATNTFTNRILTTEEFNNARVAMGLNLNPNYGAISPKQYSNILRSLYYSTYLRRTFSELALSMMSQTDYNNQLPAGVPPEIHISHKIGFFFTPDGKAGYHDCGIIYYPDKPYILCVMSKQTTQNEANIVISEISRVVYRYIDEKQKE